MEGLGVCHCQKHLPSPPFNLLILIIYGQLHPFNHKSLSDRPWTGSLRIWIVSMGHINPSLFFTKGTEVLWPNEWVLSLHRVLHCREDTQVDKCVSRKWWQIYREKRNRGGLLSWGWKAGTASRRKSCLSGWLCFSSDVRWEVRVSSWVWRHHPECVS